MAKTKSTLGRATWKGAIRVSDDTTTVIHVKAYTSAKPALKLSSVHRNCKSPIKEKLFCPVCGDVERADISKAHEWHKDRFVHFSEEELEKKPRDSVIHVDGYIGVEHLYPSLCREKTYYLLPDGAADHEAYLSWMDGLEAEESSAVAEVTIGSTTPCAIYPEDGILKMTLFQYEEDLKAVEEFEGELLDIPTSDKILKECAKMIRRNAIKNFSWTQYHNTRRRELEKLIEKKVAAGDSTAAAAVTSFRQTDAFKKIKKMAGG